MKFISDAVKAGFTQSQAEFLDEHLNGEFEEDELEDDEEEEEE